MTEQATPQESQASGRLPEVDGCPPHELSRSHAARRVATLAAESELFVSHYEYRVQLAAPPAWVPKNRPDLGEPLGWSGGVLPESKYLSFRHDLLIGSFHPGHRAKWTTHELLHGLVGFCWRPDASPFFHALAARLAEVLPVALWYYWDEAGLSRCRDHRGGGALFSAYCEACEAAALTQGGSVPAGWADGGVQFVQRELESVATARRTGRPHSHRVGTLDLMSDGLAYASAQSARLDSDTFAHWVERFSGPGAGRVADLDAYIERLEAVMGSIVDGHALTPWTCGKWGFVAQDIGWRLLHLAERHPRVRAPLRLLADNLADAQTESGVEAAIAGYGALVDDARIPEVSDVFAVGYPLPQLKGRSLRQIAEGLASALPSTMEALGEGALDRVQQFVFRDLASRAPVSLRFAADVAQREGGALGELASLEAALVHPRPADAVTTTLGELGARYERVAVSPSARFVNVSYGGLALIDEPDLVHRARAGEATTLVVVSRGEELALSELDRNVGDALAQLSAVEGGFEPPDEGLSDELTDQLMAMGVLVACAWDETC